jgi:hypothetical protein
MLGQVNESRFELARLHRHAGLLVALRPNCYGGAAKSPQLRNECCSGSGILDQDPVRPMPVSEPECPLLQVRVVITTPIYSQQVELPLLNLPGRANTLVVLRTSL